jgi:hypothetical protein
MEVRMDDCGQMDEIIFDKCHFHLENMGDGHWCIMLGGTEENQQSHIIHLSGVTRISTDILGKVWTRYKEKQHDLKAK